jgi:Raf kinase inhibitor-like YbhB/YbcL family protein
MSTELSWESLRVGSLTAAWLVLASAARAAPPVQPAPQFEWQTATPESQGMSSEKLGAIKGGLAARKTRAFLVIRNDKIVCEWYAEGNDSAKPQGTASLAKAIVGGLSLGVALSDGRIALDDLAVKYVPEWKGDPKKSKITIRQLGSHTSGLEDAEDRGVPHERLTGWKGDFWKRLPPPNGPFTHWVTYNIPASVTQFDANQPPVPTLPNGALQGLNGRGQVGYLGSCPPPGATPHRYTFQLFALDGPLPLQPGASIGDLRNALSGHVVAQTQLVGLFSR